MTDERADTGDESYDVAVVGGGPAGCAAGVFTARAGLDTVVFDRGTASLDRCAFLANYLGFPAGIDIETFSDLALAHAREAGCAVVPELVETVERPGDVDGRDDEPRADDETDEERTEGARFVVETAADSRVTATRVLAATRYDGEYLRSLGGDDMFETHEHDGEEHEHFDPDYADADGRTPVDDLYVATPSGQWDVQAIVAAGRGAHVARTLIEDARVERGYPTELARHYDWLRPDSEFEGDWGERERWREWFDERVPDDHPVDDDRLAELREEYIDEAFATRRSPEDVAELTEKAHRRLAAHLDEDALIDAVLDRIDDDRLLAAVDDESRRERTEGSAE